MNEFIHLIGTGLEVSGVIVILLGALWAVSLASKSHEKRYETFRMNLGESILLGLIVLIRTFLSFSLSIELEGTLPWRKKV